MSDAETHPFIVRRSGLRWRIYEIGADDGGIVRAIHPGLGFWRWITAARIASCLRHAYFTGRYWGDVDPYMTDDFRETAQSAVKPTAPS